METAKFLIQSGGNEDLSPEEQARVRQRDYARLGAMTGYCRTAKCLRGYILDYFGQQHAPRCGNCGNCLGSCREEDITVPAQMILSCVRRVREQLGYYVGKTLIIQTLRGSRDQRLLQLGLDRLSTYGLMKKQSAAQVRSWLDFLEADGYLRTNAGHFTLEPTAASSAVLFGGEKVSMPVRTDRRAESADREPRRKPAAVSAEAEDLFAALKAERMRIAQEEGVPAYIVFSNAALADMAARAPRTMAEFLEVSGVGAVKAERYGARILAAIVAHEQKGSA